MLIIEDLLYIIKFAMLMHKKIKLEKIFVLGYMPPMEHKRNSVDNINNIQHIVNFEADVCA